MPRNPYAPKAYATTKAVMKSELAELRNTSQTLFGFFDFETTGLGISTDAPLSVAVNVVKSDLEPLATFSWRCRVPYGVYPSPAATWVHRIGPREWGVGEYQYDSVRALQRVFNLPGMVMAGFNNAYFDNLVFRFSLHQQLLDPYQHHRGKDFASLDMLSVAKIFWAMNKAPNFPWPDDMKLASLNAAAQLAAGSDHDAEVDVDATIELARQLRMHNPMFWDETVARFDKSKDEQAFNNCPTAIAIGKREYPVGLLMSKYARRNTSYMFPVIYLGQHKTYTGQQVFLRLDRSGLALCTGDDIDAAPTVKRKFGDAAFFMPMEQSGHHFFSIPMNYEIAMNLFWLAEHPEKFKQLQEYHCAATYAELSEPLDPGAALYQTPFASTKQRTLMNDFHQAKPEQKMALVDKMDEPYKRLGLRIMMNRFSAHLGEQGRAQARVEHQHLDRLALSRRDHAGKQLTPLRDAWKELSKMPKKCKTADHRRLFDELNRFYRHTDFNLNQQQAEQKPQTEGKTPKRQGRRKPF